MDTIIGQGHITANSVIIYSSLFSKIFGRKNIELSFSDKDAYPFGRFPIIRLNQEIQFKFYIGNYGSTHGSLLQMANDENRKTLGTDWIHNPQYQNFTAMFKIQSAGRIWINRKIIVMRDERPEPNIVNYAMVQLFNNGISDIMTYNLLYMDDNNRIHKCTMDDYIKGCADSFGYKTHENLPSSHQNTNEKMP